MSDQIEQDFMDALERLKANKPKHKKLAAQVKLGKRVAINVSNVALEAGHARRLIASRKDCKYPKVRKAVLEVTKPAVAEHTAEYAIRSLREANAQLETQNQLLLSAHAALLRRMVRLEGEARRRIQKAERFAKQKTRAPVVGRTLEPESTGEVIAFAPAKERTEDTIDE